MMRLALCNLQGGQQHVSIFSIFMLSWCKKTCHRHIFYLFLFLFSSSLIHFPLLLIANERKRTSLSKRNDNKTQRREEIFCHKKIFFGSDHHTDNIYFYSDCIFRTEMRVPRTKVFRLTFPALISEDCYC